MQKPTRLTISRILVMAPLVIAALPCSAVPIEIEIHSLVTESSLFGVQVDDDVTMHVDLDFDPQDLHSGPDYGVYSGSATVSVTAGAQSFQFVGYAGLTVVNGLRSDYPTGSDQLDLTIGTDDQIQLGESQGPSWFEVLSISLHLGGSPDDLFADEGIPTRVALEDFITYPNQLGHSFERYSDSAFVSFRSEPYAMTWTPEPSTGLLVGLGLVCLGARRRR